MTKRRRREPVWVDRLVVDAIHFDQLREHGGLRGLRDENALEATLARARNRRRHEPRADLATLGAAYGSGIATGHPYHDGNKRVAFVTLATFVALNGYALEAAEEEVVQVMLASAAGRLREEDLADWVRTRLVRQRSPS